MPQFKCPQCATLIHAQPGAEAHCQNCGFTAIVPTTPGAPLAAPPPAPVTAARPAPEAAAPPPPVTPIAKSTAAWAFLASMVGLGTFFLAAYGLPFILGLGGGVTGLVAYMRDRDDRRGLIASVLGAVAVVAALLFLVL